MLDKEGAASPADVAFLGDEDAVTASIEKIGGGRCHRLRRLRRRQPRRARADVLAAERAGALRLEGASSDSAVECRVLEFVEVGLLVHQTDDVLDGLPGQRGIALGAAHQPHEHGRGPRR